MNFPQHVENRHFNFLLSKMAIEVAGNQCHILVDLSSFLEVFPLYSRVIRRTLLGKGIYMHFPNHRCATGTDDEEEEGECHPLLELSSRVPHSTCMPLVTRSASIRPEHEVGFARKRIYRADLNQR